MFVQMQIALGLAILNIFLLIAIVTLSVGAYRRMKADYTLFVIIFSALFLLQYIVGAWLYFTNMDIYHPTVSWHMLTFTAIQTVAFGYMLWMEWQ